MSSTPLKKLDRASRTFAIPTAYPEIFKDRVIIISGVGRSGTSIVGKLIGSMKNTVYLFEPAIMKYMLFTVSNANTRRSFTGTILEDYILPIMQGRSLNHNANDESYFRNYFVGARYPRRLDAMKAIIDHNYKFVIKTNESWGTDQLLRTCFPGFKKINVIRNGNDVVSSSMRKGWYTDEYMRSVVDWTNWGAPWFVSNEDAARWPLWNPITRAACVWKTLMDAWMESTRLEILDRTTCISVKYEELVKAPRSTVSLIAKGLGLEQTVTTAEHTTDICNFTVLRHDSILNKIHEPMRDEFAKMMVELGYYNFQPDEVSPEGGDYVDVT